MEKVKDHHQDIGSGFRALGRELAKAAKVHAAVSISMAYARADIKCAVLQLKAIMAGDHDNAVWLADVGALMRTKAEKWARIAERAAA